MLKQMVDALERPVMPTEIAERVILAKSYTDERDVHDALAWLRENMPLAIAELPGYDPMFVATRYSDVMEIGRDAGRFGSMPHNPILNDQVSDDFIRSLTGGSVRFLDALTWMDPPEHTEIRGIAGNYFFPGRMKRLEDNIREIARQSVARLLDFDGECDFVKDFALYYPLRVVMTILGVPPEDEPLMLKLTQEYFGVHDPEEVRENIHIDEDPASAGKQFLATLNDFFSYFEQITVDRRKNPRDDFATIIANSKDKNGEYYAEGYLNGYYVAIAAAGHDTTSSSMAGGMSGLMEFPDQFALVKSNMNLCGGLVNEAIRWTSPVRHFMRGATKDTTVGDIPFVAGDRVFLSFPSANRDGDVFHQPFTFNVERQPNRHVAFGIGPHICLGQHLAKLELQILYEELLPKIKSISLNGTPKSVQTNFVGGYKSLPVRFEKT